MIKAALIALALLATPAQATTYLLNVSPVVSGFIETDGTLGQLESSDIINWDVIFNSGAVELTPDNSVARASNAGFELDGVEVPGVFATADGIFVNFSEPLATEAGVLKFTSNLLVPDGPFAEWCFCTGISLSQHAFQYANNFHTYFFSVNQSPEIATVVAVPEPSTWALLLFGFAFVALKGIWPSRASR